ncbi:MAG: type II toxin-antitoxin system VapC family toxin [Micrococcales bacterium]|nr:type II toxin-antitoxin system VapC family toxin [Micrococcales bacterium]
MNAQYMLDTNVLVDLMHVPGDSLRAQVSAHDGLLAVSTVTVMELEYGVERTRFSQRARLQVDGVLALVDVLDFDRRAAFHAGHIRSALASQGTPIGPYDALIAGHARSAGLTLVTNNTREFSRVPSLAIVNWLEP